STHDRVIRTVPTVVPGIELSTDYEGKDLHIVGLFINHKSPEFVKYLDEFVESRDVRNRKMCDKFNELGIDITYDALQAEFPEAVITRAHYAKWLLEHGYVKSKSEAFDKYIGDRGPCYIPREKVTPKKAIELILSCDGIPIFAHPILCRYSDKKLEALVAELKEAGLMGIEAVYSTYAACEERQIRNLAKKYHLLLSGGSDFHGTNKDGIDLAVGKGKLYVDDSILEEIKSARKNLLFTDLDGTLFNKDSEITPEMYNAIKGLTERNHKFVIASGRPLASILERCELLKINFDNSYIISNNGGLIYNLTTKEKLYENKLSQRIIKEVSEMCLDAGIHVHSYTDSEIVGLEDDEEVKFYRSRVHMPLILTDSLSDYLKDGAYKLQIIHLTDREALETLKYKILCKLGNEVNAFFSTNQYLEVLPKAVSKGNAIHWLTNYLSMPLTHTFAAGDDENDIPMIEAAHTGIAMANAKEKVKAIADIITSNDNNHDGLIEIIDEYFK
ncbi:MAG: Cof-type HAD-IIB family hydrolase, partial [Lachnospiraceae bacterium]|nr:Cof-type HAD-IIB family hydrolase [Lachnospiraceae bacterium]